MTGNTNPGLFAAGPAIAANGDLTYTPAPNAFGSATITLVAQDDGGTANGGDDTSASQTFDITVTPVNDAPAFTKGANQTVSEDAGAQTVASWATGISAGPNEGGQVVTFVIGTNDNPTLFSAGPAVASDGTLTFTPAANKNGVANITLYVQDNGGTANGGDDTSDPQTFVITVSAVNDAPLAIAHNYAAQANMQIVGLTGLLTGATDADASRPGLHLPVAGRQRQRHHASRRDGDRSRMPAREPSASTRLPAHPGMSRSPTRSATTATPRRARAARPPR